MKYSTVILLVLINAQSLAQEPYFFTRLEPVIGNVEDGITIQEYEPNELNVIVTSSFNITHHVRLANFNMSVAGQSITITDTNVFFHDSLNLSFNKGLTGGSFVDPIQGRTYIGGGVVEVSSDKFFSHVMSFDSDNPADVDLRFVDRDAWHNGITQGKLTSSGKRVFAGVSNTDGMGNDFWLYAETASGLELINETYGTSHYDFGASIGISNTGYYLFGDSRGYGPQIGLRMDALLIKLDNIGNELWRTHWGNMSSDCAWNMEVLANQFVLTCGCLSQNTTSEGDVDAYVRVMDPEGNLVWDDEYPHTSLEDGGRAENYFHCKQLSNGNIVAIGYGTRPYDSPQFPFHYIPWMRMYSKSGEILMTRHYDEITFERSGAFFKEIIELHDGRLLVGGNYYPLQGDSGTQDAFIMLLDENGCEYPNCQPPIGTQEIAESESDIRVYPNPVNDHLYLSSEIEIAGVRIFRMDGVVAMEKRYSATATTQSLDCSRLASGIYIAELQDVNGKVSVRKFSKTE